MSSKKQRPNKIEKPEKTIKKKFFFLTEKYVAPQLVIPSLRFLFPNILSSFFI
jgi:hypothetical protein